MRDRERKAEQRVSGERSFGIRTGHVPKQTVEKLKHNRHKRILTTTGMLTVVKRSTSGSPTDLFRKNTKLFGFKA